jgi:hypothetical protein
MDFIFKMNMKFLGITTVLYVFHCDGIHLTLSARHPFQNFSTPCILNVNNTGAKQRSIMK